MSDEHGRGYRAQAVDYIEGDTWYSGDTASYEKI